LRKADKRWLELNDASMASISVKARSDTAVDALARAEPLEKCLEKGEDQSEIQSPSLASNLKERDPEQFWPPEDSSVCVDANKEIGLSADISATNLKYVEATESISNRIDTWDKAETLGLYIQDST